ncbi:MAG: hypothetical protein AB1507_00125 [Bacillota bacterium]|jgi:hypothetical protein|nr:hypothetical protein [Thermoanaerobacteraceae bacterium]
MPHVHDYSGRTSLDLRHRRDYEGTTGRNTGAGPEHTHRAHPRREK